MRALRKLNHHATTTLSDGSGPTMTLSGGSHATTTLSGKSGATTTLSGATTTRSGGSGPTMTLSGATTILLGVSLVQALMSLVNHYLLQGRCFLGSKAIICYLDACVKSRNEIH